MFRDTVSTPTDGSLYLPSEGSGHCYEYTFQYYKRNTAHYQKIITKMKNIFNNEINEVGKLL